MALGDQMLNKCMRCLALALCALAAHAEEIDAAKRLRELAPRLTIPEYSRTRPDLCPRLLSDLKAWRDVQVVQPFTAAGSLDQLHAGELRACKLDELVTSYSIEPRVWRENNLDALPPQEKDEYGTPFMMTKDFRLYRADIDLDAQSKELVLYGAGVVVRDTDDRSSDLTYFHVIDAEKCEVRNSAQVVDTERHLKSTVGLLRHAAKTYAFEIRHFPQEANLWLRLQQWEHSDVTKRDFFSDVCTYVADDK